MHDLSHSPSTLHRLAMFVGLLTCCLTVSASIIAHYPITGGSAASIDSEPNSLAGNADIGGGPQADWGFSGSTNTVFARTQAIDGIFGTPGSEAGSVAANDYLGFTVSPAVSYAMHLTSLTFDTDYHGSHASQTLEMNWFVRSSLDGFAATIPSSTFTEAYTRREAINLTNRVVDLSTPAFQALTTPTEFRVYVWDDSVSDRRYARFDNVVLNGSLVSTVPEPPTLALAGLGFMSVLLGFHRCRES